jgi:hypothetical protein
MKLMGFLILCTLTAAIAVRPACAAPCDQRCLISIMHQYLRAVPLHGAAGPTLSSTADIRENTQPVKTGGDAWAGVTKVNPGMVFADPTTANVIYAGSVWQAGTVMSVFVRLKVEDGKVSQAEVLMRKARESAGLQQPDILYGAVVPVTRRSSRMQLIAVANAYMDGITRHDGSIPPFDYRCDRYISGFRLTNNSLNPRGVVTCASSLDGLRGLSVVHRRFPVVDVADGIVVALFAVVNGSQSPASVGVVAEVFKVVDGKIRSIEELGAPPGNYPQDAGFPGD